MALRDAAVRHAALRLLAVTVVAVSLSGCAFARAVTFRSDPQSFKAENPTVTLTYYRPQPGRPCTDGPPLEEAAVAGVLAPLVARFAVDFAIDQIQGYLDKKKKEFTATYNASINAPYYYGRVAANDYSRLAFTCLLLTRTVADGAGPSADALRWVATLVPNDAGTAVRVETNVLQLQRAAARTDRKTRKVDVSIAVKIDATTLTDKGDITTSTVVDKTLAFAGVKLEDAGRTATSSWFPAIPRTRAEMVRCEEQHAPGTPADSRCRGISAVTLSVLVTEVGSGGTAFGDLSKQIGDNRKTIEDTLGKALSDALTPAASGGTSKGK